MPGAKHVPRGTAEAAASQTTAAADSQPEHNRPVLARPERPPALLVLLLELQDDRLVHPAGEQVVVGQ